MKSDREKLFDILTLCDRHREPAHIDSFWNRFIAEIENIIGDDMKNDHERRTLERATINP